MDLSTFANLVEAGAVCIGVLFAAWQINDFRAKRRRDSMLDLMHSFQSPTFARALRLISSLPDGADAETVRRLAGEKGEDDIYHMTGTWESIGALVFERELTIELVDSFFSGPILISWRKLEGYVKGERERLQRDTWSEWFEWLKDRIETRASEIPRIPAHVAHRHHRDCRDVAEKVPAARKEPGVT